MTINLTVRAEVIDVRTDTPQPSDTLFVDTNVWLWQTYGLPPKPDPKNWAVGSSPSGDGTRRKTDMS